MEVKVAWSVRTPARSSEEEALRPREIRSDQAFQGPEDVLGIWEDKQGWKVI